MEDTLCQSLSHAIIDAAGDRNWAALARLTAAAIDHGELLDTMARLAGAVALYEALCDPHDRYRGAIDVMLNTIDLSQNHW